MKTEKVALGFEKGPIVIFKGNTYPHLDWFRESVCKYNKIFGWYVPSTEDIPTDVPEDLTTIAVSWEKVGNESEELFGEDHVKEYLEQILYDPSPSEYIGEIKERLTLKLTITRTMTLASYYGDSTMHIMEDENENVFIWTTSARKLTEGVTYVLKGTVKAHKTYKNTKQTILTRCSVVEE